MLCDHEIAYQFSKTIYHYQLTFLTMNRAESVKKKQSNGIILQFFDSSVVDTIGLNSTVILEKYSNYV